MADGEILQRFTPPAIRVIQHAKKEARGSGSNTVGTEHILLGLLQETEGVAAHALGRLGVTLGRAQAEIRRQVAPDKARSASRSWSADARRVLELALDEARELNPKLGLPNLVDTEHLLLGLLHLPDSPAVRVLRELGVDPEQLRGEVIGRLGARPEPAGAGGEVFQRFTPAAMRVVQYAKEEARGHRVKVVGTEHILLGLLREEGGGAARVLQRSGVELGRAREEADLARLEAGLKDRPSRGWSADARRALELTVGEARELNPKLGLPNFVDTEHLLLGLLDLPDATAVRVLRALGVNPEQLRREAVELLGARPAPASAEATDAPAREREVPRHSGGVLQRFTPPAIRVVQYAKEEARRFRGNTVGTEHVLLGLIREQEGVAARVLERLGVSLGRAQNEIRRQMDLTENRSPGQTQRSWSAGARRVLELALGEARELNPKLGLPNFVDTEHLLLGLIRESDSTAARVLRALGVDLKQVRREVITLLGGGLPRSAARPSVEAPEANRAEGLTDINTRFGYDPHTGRSTTLAMVKAAGEKWGVTRAYTYSLNAVIFDVVSGNEETLAQCSPDPFFRPTAVLSPFRRGALALATPSSLKEQGFALARIFPDQHGFDAAGLAATDLLSACADAGLPVMVSVGAAPPTRLAGVVETAGCALILTGVRYHSLGEVLALAGRAPNLYVDIGGVATPDGIALLAEGFGADRLLFGSEYPSLEVGVTARLLWNSGLSEEEQARVRAGNAARLLEVGR